MLCFSACKDDVLLADSVLPIWVNNKSNMPVNFIYSRTYPDTTIPADRNKLRYADPGKKVNFELPDDSYDKLFQTLPADTLSIFIISSDTLVKYGWDRIKSEYRILKRYDVSRHDLDTGHNTITFHN